MKSKSNRFWAALLAGILLLCAAAIFYISTRGPRGPVAVIYSGGQEVRRIDLGAVTEDETFVLTGFGGLSNTVEVSEGKIRVCEADCPDQVCVMQGWLEDDIIPIACLPSGLVIQMENAPDNGVDRAVG